MDVRAELADLLTAYLMGWKSIRDCAEWLAGVDWDAISSDREIMNVVGRLELLVTEALEGLRAESEFWQEAAEFVGRETRWFFLPPMVTTEVSVADSSSDSISWSPELIVIGVGE